MRKVKAFYTLLWFDGGLALVYFGACAYVKAAPDGGVVTAAFAAAGAAATAFMIGNGMEHMGAKDGK